MFGMRNRNLFPARSWQNNSPAVELLLSNDSPNGSCSSNGGKMNKSEELLKRVQYALKKWYTIPPVMATRVDMLPELHIKYCTWIGNLEQAVKDLQNELEFQEKLAPSFLKPCLCGETDIKHFINPEQRQHHVECPQCGASVSSFGSLSASRARELWNSCL